MIEEHKKLFQFLELLGDAPTSQIDLVFTQEVKDFLALPEPSDPVVFTRNLLDKMVFCSGCSDMVVMIIDSALAPFPEDEETKAARRATIKV